LCLRSEARRASNVTPVQIDRRPLGLNACVPSRGTDRHQYARRTCLVRRCVNWLLMVEFSLRAATAASYCLRRDKQLDPSLESGDISEYASIAAIFSSCWSESDSAGIPARRSERSRNRPWASIRAGHSLSGIPKRAGFRDCGTIGARHCSLSSRRLSSPDIARGFDCIGIGRVAILKDDRVYLQKFGI
jgi:hypothetical protein